MVKRVRSDDCGALSTLCCNTTAWLSKTSGSLSFYARSLMPRRWSSILHPKCWNLPFSNLLFRSFCICGEMKLFNPFAPNAHFLCALKTAEKLPNFQVVEKICTGKNKLMWQDSCCCLHYIHNMAGCYCHSSHSRK